MRLFRSFYRGCSIMLLASLLLQTTACSFLGPKTQTISVSSDPAGAQVQINGSMVGVTPLQYGIPRNSDVSLLVTKKGYMPAQRYVGKSLSMYGVLDIIGGVIWLVPFIGLISPGAYELDQSNISVLLPEAESSR